MTQLDVPADHLPSFSETLGTIDEDTLESLPQNSVSVVDFLVYQLLRAS